MFQMDVQTVIYSCCAFAALKNLVTGNFQMKYKPTRGEKFDIHNAERPYELRDIAYDLTIHLWIAASMAIFWYIVFCPTQWNPAGYIPLNDKTVLDGSFLHFYFFQAFAFGFFLFLQSTLIQWLIDARTEREFSPIQSDWITNCFSFAAFEVVLSSASKTLGLVDVEHNFTQPSDYALMFVRIAIAELVLDLGFYTIHRILHSNRFLYKHVHAHHHAHGKLFGSIDGAAHLYEMTWAEIVGIVLFSTVPAIFTLYALSPGRAICPMELSVAIMWYRTVELFGHSGTPSTPFGFMRVLPLLIFNIKPNLVHMHTYHHDFPNKNFSKRFTFFDEYFNTLNDVPDEKLRANHKAIRLNKKPRATKGNKESSIDENEKTSSLQDGIHDVVVDNTKKVESLRQRKNSLTSALNNTNKILNNIPCSNNVI